MVNRYRFNQLALKELTAPKRERITVLTLYDLLLPDCQCSEPPPLRRATGKSLPQEKFRSRGVRMRFLKNFPRLFRFRFQRGGAAARFKKISAAFRKKTRKGNRVSAGRNVPFEGTLWRSTKIFFVSERPDRLSEEDEPPRPRGSIPDPKSGSTRQVRRRCRPGQARRGRK